MSETKKSEPFCDVALLTSEDLAKVVAQLDFVKQWVASVEKRATELATEGNLPGYKLVAGRNLRGWADEDKAVSLLKTAGYDEDQLFETKFLTVAAAEKLMGKKAFNPLQESLVEVRSGKPQLVTEDHPKPAIIEGGAESDFTKVKP